MKKYPGFLTAILLATIPSVLMSQPAAASAAPADVGTAITPAPPPTIQETVVEPWHVTERTPYMNRWETTKSVNDPVTGQPMLVNKRAFNELGVGLNTLGPNGLVPAQPAFTVTAGGAEALGAQHKARVAADIYTQGAVQVTTPAGQLLQFTPLAIAYEDPVDGSFLIIATSTNAVGWLISPNDIIYSNCFSGLRASIQIQNRLGGISQTLLLEENPIDPALLGLSPASRLQLITEVGPTTPAPTISATRVVPQTTAPAQRAGWVQPDLIDETLRFGDMKMGLGRAFTIGTPQDLHRPHFAPDSAPVAKRFQAAGERRFLFETLERNRVLDQLRQLPPAPLPPSMTNAAFRATGRLRTSGLAETIKSLPSPKRLAQASHLRIRQVAANPPNSPAALGLSKNSAPLAFATDWDLGGIIDEPFVFQADQTYYLTNWVAFESTVTIEGNTVIKLNPTDQCYIYAPADNVVCLTEGARPAIFTCRDDDSVGTELPASDHSPEIDASYNIGLFLEGPGTNQLQHLRFSYCSYGLYLYYVVHFDLRHLQFAHVTFPIIGEIDMQFHLGNALMWDVPGAALVLDCGAVANVEHLTLHEANALFYQYSTTTNDVLALTNCLLVEVSDVTNLPSLFATNQVVILTTSDGVFTNGGAGYHYLAGSQYRGSGTTNITPSLLADLGKMTTYPPMIYHNVTLTNDLSLAPQAARNTGAPDLGFYYFPIDYLFGGVTLNGNLNVAPGTVLGWYRTTSGWYHAGHGIHLGDGKKAVFDGRAEAPAWWVRRNVVQEGDTNGFTYGTGGITGWASQLSQAPEIVPLTS
jgi:hypothetical protein